MHRNTLVVASLLLFRLGFGQTAFQSAAVLFSGETDQKTYSAVTKARAIKDFSPLLNDPKDSASRVIAAFGLAMKGVNIDDNLARLIDPIKDAHDGKIEELEANRGLAENQILLEDIPNAIYRIYKAQHYVPALKILFTMPVDWPAAEYRDDCVMTQLRTDPASVISLASKDPKIYGTLWDIVDWNVGGMGDRKLFIGQMRTLKWQNKALRDTALQLAHDLSTPKNRPGK